MFDSIYNSFDNFFIGFFIMLGVAIVAGLLFSFLISFKVKSTKRFFIISAIMPAVIAVVAAITSVSTTLGAVLAISGAFGLIRFRSAQGSSEEIGVLAIELAGGFTMGLGYLLPGVLVLVVLGLVFFLLYSFNIFSHKGGTTERVLRVTLPENLDYAHLFDEEFNQFTKTHQLVRTKSVNMGSMFRLEYEVELKNEDLEKPFLDAIRVKNGNLEVALSEATRIQGQL
ncbi:MAG: DUF4956 domain-containing protein [Bacilli bacterium]|nr:DUF4956 domain-containing protein [Bacilli bacterium]